VRRLARFLRRAWDAEAGAFGQSSPLAKNALLDDIAERLFGFGWKLRP
jgi:hypothetical protein